MKQLLTIALLLIPCCICFAGAVYLLAIGSTQGWGWLLFIGLLCSGVSYNTKVDK
jgi:NADH:ubiquinone oxidoreductase subunit 2 (subunit N)